MGDIRRYVRGVGFPEITGLNESLAKREREIIAWQGSLPETLSREEILKIVPAELHDHVRDEFIG
jgi:hypothetical protein